MSLYSEYLAEIETRKTELGLNPKPIDSADLLSEIIAQIKDTTNEHREDSLKFFIYNTLPGTTPAAGVKAQFLKEIVLGEEKVEEIISYEKDKNYFVFWINHNNESRSTRVSHKELFDWFKIDQAEFDNKFVKASDLDFAVYQNENI